MSKGSGSIRVNASLQAGDTTVMSEEAYKRMLDYIQNPYRNYDNGGEAVENWDNMSNDERELALMEGGFTGLSDPDNLEMMSLYYATSKSDLVRNLAEDLSNIVSGYNIDDSTTWTVGYKDGTTKSLSYDENELGNLGITANQSYRTQISNITSALSNRKINFIIREDGYDQPRFYASGKEGMEALKKYGGFEEWKNGRGEKKRDYIQDDWI